MHLGELNEDPNVIIKEKVLGQIQGIEPKCSYCEKIILMGQDVCPWRGHQKDADLCLRNEKKENN